MSLPSRLLRPNSVAAGRAALGLSMLARPTLVPLLVGVETAAASQTAWVVQMLGAREVALGVGLLAGGDRSWVTAGVFCDTVDAAALVLAVRSGAVPRNGGSAIVAVAGLAALGGLLGLRRAR